MFIVYIANLFYILYCFHTVKCKRTQQKIEIKKKKLRKFKIFISIIFHTQKLVNFFKLGRGNREKSKNGLVNCLVFLFFFLNASRKECNGAVYRRRSVDCKHYASVDARREAWETTFHPGTS